VQWVIEKVKQFGGIDYTIAKMNEYKQEALNTLSHFPESPIRKGLEDMVTFVTDRKY
jgi:octaprenyl-diphosphate synthase